MPAPVRQRSTAAVYDEGGLDRGTTRAWQPKHTSGPEFSHLLDTGRNDHSRGSTAVNRHLPQHWRLHAFSI